jgi:HEPN domain-containing protein
MKRQAKAWLKSAYDDLLTIQELIGNELLTHVVAYHAQQAIEKSLKAILEDRSEPVPRIHNLITLRGMVEEFFQFDEDSEIFDQINELYVDSRYPTDLGYLPEGKPSVVTAAAFQDTAERIYEKVLKSLGEMDTV